VTRISLKLYFDNGERLGPGRVELLEHVRELGSIAAAGRAMGMSYRRAWTLADSLNRTFREPVIATQLGGRGGGAAVLTPLGEEVVRRYRALQARTAAVIAEDLNAIEATLRPRAGRE
jgi:molybdate transport system regulatory protein